MYKLQYSGIDINSYLPVCEFLGKTKICYLQVPIPVKEKIFWFQVPVDYRLRVQIL